MQNYVYYNPTKLYFGDRQLEKLGEVVSSYGSRVLLMYGQGSIKRNGIYEAVMNLLKGAGLQVFEFHGVEPNPQYRTVNRAADVCKANDCDVVLAVGVVVLNVQRLPYVLESIIAGAFNPRAFTGGAIGSVFLSVQKGVSRGIFSNEAGLGTGSIAHACADTRKPVKQGMFGIFEVFADTIVICTLTAMVILCSGVPVGYGAAAGAELTIAGFTATYGGWSSIFTAMALCCFAFSTIIGWGLYGSRCAEFLFRTDKVVGPFLVLYSFVSIVGATMDLGLLWNIADTFNGLMSIPNLIALLLLSDTVAKLVKEFFAGESAR